MIKRVSILGAGSWGTALALAAHRAQCQVTLWGRSLDVVETMNMMRENVVRLPGISIPSDIRLSHSLEEALEAPLLILAVPAQQTRAFCERIREYLRPDHHLILTAKGIERESGQLMAQCVSESCPGQDLSILSGPSFAREVAQKLPTALTLATQSPEKGKELCTLLSSPSFRLYHSSDLIGCQIGGAMKNVVAIACGIARGYGLGENAVASLMTRGLAETVRLGIALGANPETFLGLSGVGDMTLSCHSEQSRNLAFGLSLAQGRGQEDPSKNTIEGAHTVSSVLLLASRLELEMPLVSCVNDLLYASATIPEAIERLMNRPLKAEKIPGQVAS